MTLIRLCGLRRHRTAGGPAVAIASILAIACAIDPALALVPRHARDLDRRAVTPAALDTIPEPADPDGAAFRRRHAGAWRMTFDRRTGRPALIEGEGVPLFPGRGNGLTAAAAGLAGRPARIEDVEPLGRAFIDAEADLLRPPRGILKLNPERSAFLEDGAIVFLDYDWIVDDVPVEGARVFLRVNHGNVVQLGTERIGGGVPQARPSLEADAALARLFEHAGGRRDDDGVVEPGRLIFVATPRGAGHVAWAGGVDYRLVWRASFRRAGEPMTWTGDVDARTGEVVAFGDANRYARVTGGVHPRTVSDPEESRPFTNLRVFSSSASIQTGPAGTYTYSGGPVFTALDGTFFRISCAGCSTPPRAFVFDAQGTGDLDLGLGGVDQFGNGASTPAERNAFFHENRVRSLAKKWLSIAWLDSTVGVNVNVDDTCNAFWDGQATNFFRSGGGCNNTGEIADVMYHEWGHGLDQNTNLGDGSTGEATGDITSMHVIHDARVGPDFAINGAPVRDLDATRVGYVARVSNVGVNCPVCAPGVCSNGPFGHEVHCEGEIYGQTEWELAQALVAKHGYNTGWQTLERIYFLSLPASNTMVSSSAQSAYSAYLAVDDDNGNLADGTPNCLEIYNTFNAHGIAGAACAGNTAGCVRPAQPTPTATQVVGRIALDWTASAGAVSYKVLRADFSPAQVYIALGSVAGTHFEDTTTQPGIVYYYVIEAQNATGCRSTIENALAATALPESRLVSPGTAISDIPAGNRSGTPDPGESIDLTMTLRNQLPAGPAPAVTGVVSSPTPNVGMVTSAVGFGAIAPGATAAGSASRAALGAALACGQDISFSTTLADGADTPPVPSFASVLIGARQPLFSETFDDLAIGWTVTAGSPAATAGAWTFGDPVGTTWQPESDSGTTGSNGCAFTGQNSGDTAGDVDGGETILTSPIINLGGASAARLSYRRWWGDSSLTDAGDALIVEVSGDGGGSWVAAETIGAAARNLGWQPVDIRLETLVPLTANFRVRFRARDGGTESTVEAAIDDVTVERVVCDLTPPCFVPPSFGGLASVVTAASCGETDLAWAAGSTSCLNAVITYSIYRSTFAGFTPAPANRIASGVGGTAFHDTLLVPGVTYHYVVRAADSRSGEDANLVDRSVVVAGSPDLLAPLFPGLGAVQSGGHCGETTLAWAPAAESCSAPPHYNVYRSVNPGFTPGAANRIASVLGTGYVDTALIPNQTYYYKVRAQDSAGNEETNSQEHSAPALILPRILYHEGFEASDGGWTPIAPNDAATGRFEWGDPEGTGVQPEDDATPAPGTRAWVTGLAAGSGVGSFDVDTGTTTLASPILDISGQPSPVLEMSLFFSNDAGALPGEDPLKVDVSGNGGASWTNVLNSLVDIAPWTTRQFPLSGIIAINNQFRIRVQTQDLGAGGSLVEAGMDEVRVLQPNAGCSGCDPTVNGVGTILVTRSGNDIVLDWSADPSVAAAYNVYLRTGANLATAVRAGSTSTRTFVHAGAALLLNDNFYYEVTAVDDCGKESTVP